MDDLNTAEKSQFCTILIWPNLNNHNGACHVGEDAALNGCMRLYGTAGVVIPGAKREENNTTNLRQHISNREIVVAEGKKQIKNLFMLSQENRNSVEKDYLTDTP